MSTCPSKDLHSVYLDNELPETYKAKYEAHVNSCEKCQKELAALRSLQNIFKKDAAAITPGAEELDESFKRLQIKMKYNKNIVRNSKSSGKPRIMYFVSAAAAAAVFAMIIPVRLINTNAKEKQSVQAVDVASLKLNKSYPGLVFGTNPAGLDVNTVDATNVSLNSGKTVVISGNIDKSVFGSENMEQRVQNSDAFRAMNVSTMDTCNTGIEIFRPDFSKNGQVYIKITLPELQ